MLLTRKETIQRTYMKRKFWSKLRGKSFDAQKYENEKNKVEEKKEKEIQLYIRKY